MARKINPTQQELENLIELLRDARDQVLHTIINSGGVGTKVYYNTILKQLETQLKRTEKNSAFYVRSVIPKEYQNTLDELYGYFKKNNLQMKKPQAFAQIHDDAIHSIANEMQFHIGQGLEQAGRQIIRYIDDARDDALRQAGLRTAGQKIASGSTVQDMRNNLIDRLQNEGFMTVQYGQGKNAYQVPIDTYASMVARSTTREAGNLARENQLIENGYDLVKMTTHYPTCDKCVQFQGRVYSLTGKDKRFPSLFETAFKSGYRNVHPNCRHSIVPFIEELQTDEELSQALTESNKPFEDSRSDHEKGLYSKGQVLTRQVRQDKYQYERYKARLGEDAPKSFHSFRNMKKAGGDGWDKTLLDYKRRSKLANSPELKLPNAGNAFIEEPKFTKYFFGGTSSDGLSKGVAFESHLGYNISNWKEFEQEILEKVHFNPSKFNCQTEHGEYYNIPMVVYGKKGNPMDIMTAWEIKDVRTRFVTAFPNNKKE